MPLAYPSSVAGTLISGDLDCDDQVTMDDVLYALNFIASAGLDAIADCPSPLASPLS